MLTIPKGFPVNMDIDSLQNQGSTSFLKER
ncbi:Uncharacterised protein [Vibrio cholerae]|nr:Uncharacterised protein [Vibrio cholerae]